MMTSREAMLERISLNQQIAALRAELTILKAKTWNRENPNDEPIHNDDIAVLLSVKQATEGIETEE